MLSDRGVTPELVPIPMLLATGAVHHHLVREGLRTQCGLLCETGEARDVAQFALLIGYGAGAINPYLAFETIAELVEDGTYVPTDIDVAKAIKNYLKACDKGLLKTMAKMGISTLQSYRGAQIFEAVGLDRDLVERCFTGTRVARLGRQLRRSREGSRAAPRARVPRGRLRVSGARPGRALSMAPSRRAPHLQSRHGGEASARRSARRSRSSLRDLQGVLEGGGRRGRAALHAARALPLPVRPARVPLDEVEPASEIVKRFCTGAMSLRLDLAGRALDARRSR